MNQNTLLKFITLIFAASVITACASTGPIGEWRKEGFSGPLNDILVIGVTSRSTRRRVFEDKFVEELAARGVNATPSYQLIESSMYLSREIVEKAIQGQNLGAVVVTRLAAIKETEVYQPPDDQDENLSYFTFYDKAFHQQERGTTTTYGVLTLETNLYDTQSGELVWSMQSQAIEASQPSHIVEEYIALAIKTLAKRGLIGE
ncbi:MAG: hypothetical protein OEV07_06810 [Gammaproteobacteria bacterium]|nr:hypothetical protein [Gammaproteobacteria bacterium]